VRKPSTDVPPKPGMWTRILALIDDCLEQGFFVPVLTANSIRSTFVAQEVKHALDRNPDRVVPVIVGHVPADAGVLSLLGGHRVVEIGEGRATGRDLQQLVAELQVRAVNELAATRVSRRPV